MSELSNYQRMVEKPYLAKKEAQIKLLNDEIERLRAALAKAEAERDVIRAETIEECAAKIAPLMEQFKLHFGELKAGEARLLSAVRSWMQVQMSFLVRGPQDAIRALGEKE